MLNICSSDPVVWYGGSQAAGASHADVSERPPAARGGHGNITALCYCAKSAARKQSTPTQHDSTVQYTTGIYTQNRKLVLYILKVWSLLFHIDIHNAKQIFHFQTIYILYISISMTKLVLRFSPIKMWVSRKRHHLHITVLICSC